jgi:Methyltransferase domain
MNNATELYISGEYANQHLDWHLSDASNKVKDILSYLQLVVEISAKDNLRIGDIGAGVGGVLHESIKVLKDKYSNLRISGTGFEISPSAVEKSRKIFPNLDIQQKAFEKSDTGFDVVMFIDVLEHLENPWEMLRIARETSEFMIIRQPLIENFSTFRQNQYRLQKETWGHIAYFNYYSFIDMAQTTGWKPIKLDLCPPWNLEGENKGKASLLNKSLVKINHIMASYLLSGFYLNGVFQRF